MNRQATAGRLRFFQGISDPRARNARHLPSDILTIAILAVRRRRLGGGGKLETRQVWVTNQVQWLGRGIRQHWGVENQRHWCLDVSMNEDQSRLRVAHGAENFSRRRRRRRRRRRIALNKRKRWDIKKANGQSFHAGIHLKQQACGWSHQALLEAVLA